MTIALMTMGLGAAPVLPQEQESSGGGGAPGSTMPLSFSASLGGSANYRTSVDLQPGSDSAVSTRLGGSMQWDLHSPRTTLYANLTPYYEWFSARTNFASYGASAGLGLSRQATPRRSWNLQSTFEATPDQDRPQPATSEDPGLNDPQVRLLVPRNGYIDFRLNGSSRHQVAERIALGFNGSASSRRYNVYEVDETGEGADQLVDQRQVGVGAALSWQSSSTASWSGSINASRNFLDDTQLVDGGGGEDTRDQVQVNVAWSKELDTRSSLRLGAGYSVLGTGGSGAAGLPTLDVAWRVQGERTQGSLVLRTDQGIFPGSTISTSGGALAGRMSMRTGRRSALALLAAYVLTAEAEENGNRTRTRNLYAGWSRIAGSVTWRVGLGYGRQRSEGGPGQSVETARLLTGLAWRITGRGGAL